jgi:hypothetical protein
LVDQERAVRQLGDQEPAQVRRGAAAKQLAQEVPEAEAVARAEVPVRS